MAPGDQMINSKIPKHDRWDGGEEVKIIECNRIAKYINKPITISHVQKFYYQNAYCKSSKTYQIKYSQFLPKTGFGFSITKSPEVI